jgi:Ca2+:H+ antiporter
MMVCNSLVGVCIFIGCPHYREQDVQLSGTNLHLSVLYTMATITLILPNYTLTKSGPVYAEGQLEFVSVMTILLYSVFLYTQTIRHREYFVSVAEQGGDRAPISSGKLTVSVVLLLVSLLAVVLLAKKFSLVVDAATAPIGAPPAFAVAACALDKQLVLGLSQQNVVELVLTFILSMLTFGTGRTNILFGLVHMMMFAVFLFLVFVP